MGVASATPSCYSRSMNLEDIKPYLATVARRYGGDVDDLVQEGLIAYWQAYSSGKKNPDSFAKKAATWRIEKVAYGNRPAFGAERRSWGGATVADAAPMEALETQSAAAVDNSLAYHYAEIADAVGRLPDGQRRYVLLRFWAGLNTPEINKEFGYAASPLWARAKNKLRLELAHLEDAA